MFQTDVSCLSRQSHAKVKIKCQFEITDNCVGINELQYRDAMNNIERNDGKYICLHCSRYIKSSGSDNPNCQYHYDRDLLKIIDTNEKAYLLGWIASDGTIKKDSWTIQIAIDKIDIRCLEELRDIVCENIPVKPKTNTNLFYFDINSRQVCEDACRHLQINRGKKSDVVKFPNLDNDELTWAFLRGYFDGDGSIVNYENTSTPNCSISSNSESMLKSIGEFAKIPYKLYKADIYYFGTNCIDFLGKLYDPSSIYRLQRKYEAYIDWITWKYYTRSPNTSLRYPECYLFKTDKDAILPSKSKTSDVGYDLSIIKEETKMMNNIILYDTGLKIRVQHGLYAEVIPRSSLSKSGYMLANSIGIIDPNYNGNIFIALIKVIPDAPEIKFPFRCCQLIFRKQYHVNLIEVAEPFDETSRNEGGFGSTGI
jgi:dUTP pyrophosphatase